MPKKTSTTYKMILFFLFPIIIFSCVKSKDNNLELNENESADYSNEHTYKQESETTTTEQTIGDSISVIDGIYQNNKKEEIFHYDKIYLQPKGLKGKWINTTAIVSFQGENRNTLILGYTYNGKNHRGTYLMNSYIGNSNGVEVFKYEKIEGDNEEEYFNFSFCKNDKLTITNIKNGDIFILTN